MTQLILDADGYNLVLPESRKGGYTPVFSPLSVDVEMITGRLVRELRGNVWKIDYQYGYFTEDMKNLVIAACEKGKREPITCGFLPPTSTSALNYSRFWVMDFSYPKFYWSRPKPDGTIIPLWGDFNLSLREVKPGD